METIQFLRWWYRWIYCYHRGDGGGEWVLTRDLHFHYCRPRRYFHLHYYKLPPEWIEVAAVEVGVGVAWYDRDIKDNPSEEEDNRANTTFNLNSGTCQNYNSVIVATTNT